MKNIYPLSIFPSRYMGTYSGGSYLAFNRRGRNQIPNGAFGGDVPCEQYFGRLHEHKVATENGVFLIGYADYGDSKNGRPLKIGIGSTPDGSLKNLEVIANERDFI